MFTDIHEHILPGIDDGAADMETAINMLRVAQINGLIHIITTPHYIKDSYENNNSLVTEKCKELSSRIASENIQVSIYPGCEAFIFPELPEYVRDGEIPTLNGSSYVLVELPLMSIPEYTDDVLYKLQLYGYTPIIAHPERYIEIIKNPNRLYSFVERGILAQVNSTSLTKIYGSKVYAAAVKLLKHGLIHFVASDAHSCGGRSPKLTKAYNVVASLFDIEVADKLFSINGQAVLNNEKVEKGEPMKVRTRWFNSLGRR